MGLWGVLKIRNDSSCLKDKERENIKIHYEVGLPSICVGLSE